MGKTSSRRQKSRKLVYLIGDQLPQEDAIETFGGKGASLDRMVSLGAPVPPGIKISTSLARALEEHHKCPKRFWPQFNRAFAQFEQQTGCQLGNPDKPLVVSVRSGARQSMPGMMDTVLNIATREDLESAIEQVLLSWDSDLAAQYRAKYQIPYWWGTGIVVQQMVFGNKDLRSCTGVIFSRDTNTGENKPTGEFLVCAQGHDLVNGEQTPQSIDQLQEWDPLIYDELIDWTQRLEREFDDVVDVEFTVESGKLYLLQCRKAKMSAKARAVSAVHFVWEDRWTKQQAVQSLPKAKLRDLSKQEIEEYSLISARRGLVYKGIAASPGAVVGIIAQTATEISSIQGSGHKAIFWAKKTYPEHLKLMMAADAIITEEGGMSCHAALTARDLGKPCIVGLGKTSDSWSGCLHTMSGTTGEFFPGYSAELTNDGRIGKELGLFQKWTWALASWEDVESKIDFALVERKQDPLEMVASFYLTEALATQAKETTFACEANRLQEEIHGQIAAQLATYLILACAGEARHALRILVGMDEDSAEEKFYNFLRDTLSLSSGRDRWARIDAQEKIVAYLSTRGGADVIAFLRGACTLFSYHGWESAFGGKKWANIAEAALMYLCGEIPRRTFIDHTFDLHHNTGSVFGKHPMASGDKRKALQLKKAQDAKHGAIDIRELFANCADIEVRSDIHNLFIRGCGQGTW